MSMVVTASCLVDGERGPHTAIVLGQLPSGRVVLWIRVGTRNFRVITEPANVHISRDAAGATYQFERTAS